MFNLRRKSNRKSKNSNQLARGFGSIMPGNIIAIVGILGMASISLAQGDTWTTKTPISTARWGLSTCVLDGKIYAFGGTLSGTLESTEVVEAYNTTTNTWRRKADMPTTRTALSTTAINGTIYAIGGTSSIVAFNRTFDTVEVYDTGLTVNINSREDSQPQEFQLYQNYPNPFNPETTISFALPKQSHVVLKIYNTLGKAVRTLIDEVKPAGKHRVVWNSRE